MQLIFIIVSFGTVRRLFWVTEYTYNYLGSEINKF